MSEPPVLTPSSVLFVSREGGVGHFPGLARPRRIVCAEYSDAQLRFLQQRLGDIARRCQAPTSPHGADRRVYHLWLVDAGDATPRWSMDVAEDQAAEAVADLWKQGHEAR